MKKLLNVAFIPVRGGSKSIPLKNIRNIAGRPLVFWGIKAACECEYIDKVFVATDSALIKDTVEGFASVLPTKLFSKILVIGRSEESATDTASTEFAMLEFAEKYDFQNIVLIQATSPLLTAEDLNRGFEKFLSDNTDSVLSVVRQKRFNWQINDEGLGVPINYDVFHRPRRQEFSGYLVENGAFYITSKIRLLETKNRISGRIKAVEMPEDTYYEIDEPADWDIIESLLLKRHKFTDVSRIKMFLTDCDGCLTDGGMYYSELGDELKKFNTRDGMALGLMKNNNIITGIITGECTKIVEKRAKKLSVDILEQGCKNKLQCVQKLCAQYSISLDSVLYIGDDINDIELLKAVGISCAPADAMPQVKEVVDYVSACRGGNGVIRDIYEWFMRNA